LKELGKLDLMREYREAKSWSKSRSPRSLTLSGQRAEFAFAGKTISAWSGVEEPPDEQ